ncbi:ketopantoate reductase family protein [Salinisphaera aquimarina]|uniref:2-dehydropantoate 2-reductase n=1 Tax=Salinisphaera aquimarina TaxID=2094031 RepID=A0ABV7EMJ0_9GAMM
MTALSLPHWILAGAGNIGTLAASHLIDAGHGVTVLHERLNRRDKTLTFADGRPPRQLQLPCRPAASIAQPIRYLAVVCKTPYTASAIEHLPLAADATVLRLQNGMGSLDGLLPNRSTCIEAVTTSAVKGSDPVHDVVAENQTWMGGPDTPPGWYAGLAAHWPGLAWSDAIRDRQWQKLVANAAINPLTAIHDVANGRLLEVRDLRERMTAIVAEADALLQRLDPLWPGDSLANVEAIARATAGNTSSMRADVQRGAATEIDAINGWLLDQARHLGLAMPANARVVAELKRRADPQAVY